MNESKEASIMPDSIQVKRREHFLENEKRMLERQKKWKEERKAKVSVEKSVKESFVCQCGNKINITKPTDTERKCFKCNFHHIKENGEWINTGIKTTRRDVEPKIDKPRSRPLTFGDIVVKMRHKK
jgi:hypothetical protein